MNNLCYLPICFAPPLAFAITWLAIYWLLRSGLSNLAMDDPNHRSLHTTAVPRTGGIASMVGVLAGWSTLLLPWLWLPLGFLAAAFGVIGWQRGLWPWWFAPLVFSPFVVDASVTLFKRLLRREKIWQAHREHYYQRLVRMKFGHRNTALLAAVGGSALWGSGRGAGTQVALLVFWAIAYLVAMRRIDIEWTKYVQTSIKP